MARMKAALYARVSTRDQQTIPAQLGAMRAECERRGWQVALEIEEKLSGRKNDRPGRRRIIEAAERGQIGAVMVWKLDRWGRSTVDLIDTITKLHERGAAFVSLTEQIDFSTTIGRAMMGMLAVFAEFERSLMVERVRAGLEQARQEGKRLGRPATAKAKMEKIRELKEAGHNRAEIARLLQIGYSSVLRALQN
jgi:DNA invertase Pin-like site-specific DNA recombinase